MWAGGGALLIAGGTQAAQLYIPESASVPFGVYHAGQVPPHGLSRNDLVLVCLPEVVGRWARARGYVGGGRCAGGVGPVGKVVVGMPGDTIRIATRGITVDGVPIPNSRRLRVDHRGRWLPHGQETTQVLSSGQMWLASPSNARGFDSRYFGAIPRTNVRAILRPLWTR